MFWQKRNHQRSKKRRIYVLAATLPLLLILIPAIYFGLQYANSVQAVWMDDAWAYRIKIPVTAHSGAETNVYFAKTIDTSDTTKFQSDCGDLRFTDNAGKVLKYYIASGCSSASTVIHVLVPVFPAGATDYYYYYGNPSAVNGFDSADFTAGTGVTVGSVGSEEKGQGPIAYWSFDEGTGTTTNDSSSNRKTATFGASTAAPTWVPADQCVSGRCINFDGTNDYLDIGSSAVYQNTSKTVSIWANPSVDPAATTPLVSSGGANWYVGFAASGQMIASYNVTANTQQVTYSNSSKVVKNTWSLYTYVFSVSGSNVDVSFYVNGVFDKTNSFATGYGSTFSNSWIMGAFTSGSLFYNGKLDEVKIYNYARTSAQIKADFAARGGSKGVSTSQGTSNQKLLSDGLVGYWKMDEASWTNNCSTTSVLDSSGNSNNGSACPSSTGPTGGTAGKYGNGGTFDGSDDYSSVAAAATINNVKSSITTSAWIKTSAAATTQGIWTKRNSSFYVYNFGGANKLRLAMGTAQADSFGTTTLATGTWYFVTATYSDSGDRLARLYINGVEETYAAQGASTGSLEDDSAFALTLGKNGSSFFNGTIDDLRIYNRAFSPQEVRKLYASAPGPVGYWNMDEHTGTSANDLSGNSQTGSFTGFPSWRTGKFGSALQFDGSSQAVTATISDPITSNTVEAWIYPTTSIASKTIITSGKLATNGSSQPTFGTCTGTAISLNAWTHIVGVSDGASICKIYQNGILSASNTTGVSLGTSINIGASSFAGLIDEVKVYNYPRTANQVIEDMNGSHPIGGSPVGSQVAYWSMDETNGTTAHDSGPNANSLTLSAASWTTSGKTNSAWNGTGTVWLTRADDDDFDLTASDDMSMSMWFMSSSATNPASTEYLLAKGRSTPPGYALYLNTSGFLCLSIDDDVTWTPDDSACTTTDVYDGTWHHVVAEKTGTSEMRLYVDGKSAGSDTSIVATGTLANALAVFIGDDDGDATNAFHGYIDEVKVYRSALTVDQVALDMNAGAATNYGSTATSESTQITGSAETPPINYWSMDEKTGTTTADSGTGVKNGTISGNTIWASGKKGSALKFDGSSGVDAIGGYTPPSIITYETWFNANSLGENSLGRLAVHTNFDIFLQGSTITFQANWSTAGKWTVPLPSLSAWHHLVVVYNFGATSNTPTIYVDGISQTVTNTQAAVGSLTLSSATLRLGNTSGDDRTFDGLLDDVKIFDYARTAAQAAYDYNRGAPIGWWQFDECQGTTAYDASGNGNNATMTFAGGTYTQAGTCNSGTASDAWYGGATGKFNSSIAIDTSNDIIDIGNVSLYSFERTNPFSTSIWIKTPNDAAMSLIAKQDGASPFSGWGVQTGPGGIIYFALVNTYGTNMLEMRTSSISYSDNAWHNIVTTYDGSSLPSGVHIYFDGKDKVLTSTSNLSATTLNSIPVTIGSRNDTDQKYAGLIDDARIYNYVLTQSQVNKIFTGGGGVNFGPVTGSP